jgi:hypothetical protein
MTLGAIPYTIVSLAVFGLVLIIGGYLMESVVNMNNELIATPDLPYSMQRVQTLGVLALFFRALGVLALICAVIFLVMNANQQVSGEV